MHIYYTITRRCNLSCKHCIRGEGCQEEMPLEQALDGLRKLSEAMPDADIVLTGGEPTLHSDFEEILTYALGHFGGKVTINSNGLTEFFREKVYSYLDEKNLIVQFSIDGTMEAHERVRGKGTYAGTMNRLRSLRRIGFTCFVSTTVSRENADTIVALGKELEEFGIALWNIGSLMPFGRAQAELCLDVYEWNELVDGLIRQMRVRMNVRKLYDTSLMSSLSEADIEKLAKNCVVNCGSGTKKIYVYPDMQVYGCTCITEYPFGNLLQDSIKDIMTSEAAERIIGYEVRKDSPCHDCRYLKICNGGCIGMSTKTYGIFGMGDVRCPLHREGSSHG